MRGIIYTRTLALLGVITCSNYLASLPCFMPTKLLSHTLRNTQHVSEMRYTALYSTTFIWFMKSSWHTWMQDPRELSVTLDAVVRWRILFYTLFSWNYPDNKIHGADMGPTWVISAPDWPHEPCWQCTWVLKIRLQNQNGQVWLLLLIYCCNSWLIYWYSECNMTSEILYFSPRNASLWLLIFAGLELDNIVRPVWPLGRVWNEEGRYHSIWYTYN